MEQLDLIKILKVLADENRLKIISILQNGEHCACRLLESLNLSQPTLSHHMKQLCDCELVQGRKEGKWTHYTLNEKTLKEVVTMLDSFTQPVVQQTSTPLSSNGKCQLYLLSGFLGSGKTTILTKLLDGLPNKKLAVIQNEFGKLGIDGEIIRKNDIEMVELNRGSIFCSCLKLNFVNALSELALMEPDYIFVESSGLGDPSNLNELIAAANLLCGDRITISGSLALADGLNFLSDLENMEMVHRQIKHCNMAVITKVDCIDPETLDQIKEVIRSINDQCLIRVSSFGSLDLGFLGEDLTVHHNADSESSVNMVDNKPKTISLQCKNPVPKELLLNFLKAVQSDCYRIKGFFQLEEEGFCQVDVVGSRIDIAPAKEHPLSQLVFISKIGPAVIKKVFQAWNDTIPVEMELKN